jgi:hypothetical protein
MFLSFYAENRDIIFREPAGVAAVKPDDMEDFRGTKTI